MINQKLKQIFYFCILVFFQSFFTACSNDDIEVTILHFNDVYEIDALSNGSIGGLARVASLKKQLTLKEQNVITIVSGDFLSPSAIGRAKVNGERLQGKHMVSVLNALGVDYAVFGNHEFDLKEASFRKRLDETNFTWIASNVKETDGTLFKGQKLSEIITFENKSGQKFRIGLFGLTIASNKKKYVSYEDPLSIAEYQVSQLKNKSDAIIAITHLNLSDDEQLVEQNDEISIVLGGHEHQNFKRFRGENFTPILKADINVRSVNVIKLKFNTKSNVLYIKSSLIKIDDSIIVDPDIEKLVKGWVEKAFDGFRKEGFKPEEIIGFLKTPLDGRESRVRHRPTNLTRIISDAMVNEATGAELAVFNSGSIRIDDKLSKGDVIQYDVMRIMPFGGKVLKIAIKGSVLKSVLKQGKAKPGDGSFLQTTDNVVFKENAWLIDDKPIDCNRIYLIAINDYLACGNQKYLEFLHVNDSWVCGPDALAKPPNPDIKLVEVYGDIRQAIIKELRKTYPKKS